MSNNTNGGVYITKFSDKNDVAGLLGKEVLDEPNKIYKIFTVRPKSKFSFTTIRICNVSEDPASESSLIIWISYADKPEFLSKVDIVDKIKLASSATTVLPGYTLSPKETIYVSSSTADVVVRVEGSDNSVI